MTGGYTQGSALGVCWHVSFYKPCVIITHAVWGLYRCTRVGMRQECVYTCVCLHVPGESGAVGTAGYVSAPTASQPPEPPIPPHQPHWPLSCLFLSPPPTRLVAPTVFQVPSQSGPLWTPGFPHPAPLHSLGPESDRTDQGLSPATRITVCPQTRPLSSLGHCSPPRTPLEAETSRLAKGE